MLLSSSYATSYLIRRNYTWCLLGFDLILSSTLYVNGDCNSETLFRKQLMMIWLDATSSKIALSFRAIRHFEWCSIFYFFMKDNVHPSPSFNCCSWGSLSGLESLWIWHRKPGLSRVLFLLPPRLLPFALCNSAVIRAKRSGFWSLPCGHCNNPKSMVRKEETVVLLNKPIFYGKYKVDALAPTWPNLYFLQHKSQ